MPAALRRDINQQMLHTDAGPARDLTRDQKNNYIFSNDHTTAGHPAAYEKIGVDCRSVFLEIELQFLGGLSFTNSSYCSLGDRLKNCYICACCTRCAVVLICFGRRAVFGLISINDCFRIEDEKTYRSPMRLEYDVQQQSAHADAL